jgi:tRNA-dihydrouridine synthase B
MGCPVPKVVKNGDGSALLNNPKQVAEVVKAVVSNTKKPVTVKIRIGWDKDSINAVEVAKIIENQGASAISVHGRTRDQFYNGNADWNMIKQVKKSVKIPVIGSGDVFSGADAIRMLSETGCDFVMIARGALGNPWIFKEAISYYENQNENENENQNQDLAHTHIHTQPQSLYAKPSLDEKYEIITRHFDLVIAEKGEENGVREMRKHIGWYLKGVHGSCEIRRQVNSMKTEEEVKLLLASLKTLK